MEYFTVKNFDIFQHYKDRSPPLKRKYLSGKKRREIWKRFGCICQNCGCETKLFGNTISPFDEKKPCAIDHIIPFSKGGKCEDNNFQLLCITCNSQKGAKYAEN
jgi:5-methylcytosine-specific restriction endonuclease McrA